MEKQREVAQVGKKEQIRKMVLTAILACLGFVLSTFVWVPNMAPFQHFINVLAAVFVGPWYGLAAAFITGGLRMVLTGRSILAIIGGIFGAFLAGYFYKFTGKIYMAVIGEVIGTGIISALVSYPIMKYGFGLDLQHFYFYIPFFLPASLVGGIMGATVLYILKKSPISSRIFPIKEKK